MQSKWKLVKLANEFLKMFTPLLVLPACRSQVPVLAPFFHYS